MIFFDPDQQSRFFFISGSKKWDFFLSKNDPDHFLSKGSNLKGFLDQMIHDLPTVNQNSRHTWVISYLKIVPFSPTINLLEQ